MATGKGSTLRTSDLARELGISRQRVNELGRLGKIIREPGGGWDLDRVRVQLAGNTEPRQKSPARDRATPPAHQVGAGGGRKAHRERSAPDAPRRGTQAYETLRLTREKADREALDRKTLEGGLLKRDEVKSAWSKMLAAFKNALLPVADELCDKLAATTDPIRCREMVDTKIHEALSQLAEYPARA